MLRFQVEGMSCGHCVQAVTKAVKAIDPQAQVAVDLPAKRVSVESARPPEAVAKAIRGAGYEAAPL